MGVIIDSSVLIAAERGRLDWIAWQETLRDEQQFITVITLSELWHGWHRAQNQEQRSRRERFIRSIEDRFPILAIGVAEARVQARLWSELSVAGELIGAHDLLIRRYRSRERSQTCDAKPNRVRQNRRATDRRHSSFR